MIVSVLYLVNIYVNADFLCSVLFYQFFVWWIKHADAAF